MASAVASAWLTVLANSRVYVTSAVAPCAEGCPRRWRGGGVLGDGADALLEELTDRGGGEIAGVPGDAHRGGDGVAGTVGRQLRAGEDRGLGRVDVAGHDVQQPEHDVRTDDERVDHQVRSRGVTAAAGDDDREVVLAGHDRSRPGGEAARRKAGDVVQAVERVDRKPVEQAVLDHGCSTLSSAGWKMNRTVPSRCSSRVRDSAAPRTMAMWPSCPQACMVPS